MVPIRLVVVDMDGTLSMEVMGAEVSKKKALEKLSQSFNIAREEILTIGNSLNDFDMLKWAGLGVAMENSDDSLLKRFSNVSKFSNDEDDVYHI